MKRRSPAAPGRSAPQATVPFVAGCGRRWDGDAAHTELAHTALAFPECPACPHRVRPEGAADFCTLRPAGTAHPFAALATLKLD